MKGPASQIEKKKKKIIEQNRVEQSRVEQRASEYGIGEEVRIKIKNIHDRKIEM